MAPEVEQYAARLVHAPRSGGLQLYRQQARAGADEAVNRYVSFGSSPRGARR